MTWKKHILIHLFITGMVIVEVAALRTVIPVIIPERISQKTEKRWKQETTSIVLEIGGKTKRLSKDEMKELLEELQVESISTGGDFFGGRSEINIFFGVNCKSGDGKIYDGTIQGRFCDSQAWRFNDVGAAFIDYKFAVKCREIMARK